MTSIKSRVFAALPAAYAEVSQDGRLPAPARNVGYAVRRLTGLGDALDLTSYFLKGPHGGLLNEYLDTYPNETADWDVIRDDRGSFYEPHTGREVKMGTLAVRRHLQQIRSWDGGPDDDRPPRLGLIYPTVGPVNLYGTVLYLEKEGFAEVIAAARFAQRWDVGIVSCKGYSVRAARQFVRALHDEYGVRVLVGHDFDKAGIGIFDTLGDGDFTDIGLRWADITDPRWDLDQNSEPVSYGKNGATDPGPNLRLRGASAEEIAYLVRTDEPPFEGRRVELNALRDIVAWLDTKMAEHGVTKVIPGPEVLESAYRRAYTRGLVNQRITKLYRKARREGLAAPLPEDLVTRVTEGLDQQRDWSWDLVIAELVRAALAEERGA